LYFLNSLFDTYNFTRGRQACHYQSSIAAGRKFIAGQAPELNPMQKVKYTVTTKSQMDIRLPEPLLIPNCSRLFQRPAQCFC